MTTALRPPEVGGLPAEEPPTRAGREWLANWNPEDDTWDQRLAWRTLTITTYNLTLAFITWFLVSAIAPRLNNIGFGLSTTEL